MSNIGKQPVNIPDGVNVNIKDNNISIKGKLGELHTNFNPIISIEVKDNFVYVKRPNDIRTSRELHGLYRALINNMVKGVTDGFSKELHMNGVGYTAELKNTFLMINAGYSHAIYLEIPSGINIELPNATTILIKGIDKQNVGDVAAKIRQIRKPEPYKGKGIRYTDEVVRRKVGKKAVSA